MNSENSKKSDIYRLLLNFTDKIDLKGRDKYVVLSNLNMHYISQKYKKVIQKQHEMKNLIFLMDRILYQTFKITLNTI